MSEPKKKKPMNFGKVMLASACGTLIVFVAGWILIFLLTIGMVASLSTSDDTIATVTSNTFLTISLKGTLPERTPDKVQQMMGDESSIGLVDMLGAIDAAAEDENIKGIYLKCSAEGPSWAQAEELRDALMNFRESGKPIVAYGDTYSQSSYYIATAATSLNIHPSGMVDFRGIGGEVMFYKDLLDKLDIHMQLIRPTSCAYKSAGEVYTMNHMSDANREQIRAYIGSIWQHVCQQIGDARHMTVDSLNHIADNLTGYLALDAVDRGLIDTTRFESEVRNLIKEQYEGKRLLAISKYAAGRRDAYSSEDHVAIIYAQGNVVDGSQKGLETNVYGNDVVKALDKATRDDHVKAVVLRVNSPGGSVIASEAMTNAVMRCKAKKPVVVSMSDVAASAGYEISCNANCIVAQPTTITGSIGVFATLPNVGDMMRKKLGLTTDTVMTNRNSTGISVFRPLSPAAMKMMQRNVEDFYVTFVGRVAQGRNLSYEHIDSIAKGRVWTGADALQIGLVDELGGVELAVMRAKELAKLPESAPVIDYPAEEDALTRLSKMYGMGGDEDDQVNLLQKMRTVWQLRALKKQMPPAADAFEQQVRWFTEAEGMQARMEWIMIEL